MDTTIRDALVGGDPHLLGRTEELVLWVLNDQARLPELFEILFDANEIVRMRVYTMPWKKWLVSDLMGLSLTSKVS